MFSTTPLSPGFDIDKSEARRVISILTVTFVFATITVPLRFMSKWKLKLPFFLEDWLVLGASVLAAGPVWTFEESARKQELGRHVEYNGANAQINFRKKMYACELLYILAICLTKLSILAFYWRTFGQMIRLPIIATACVVMCGDLVIFTMSVMQCNPIHKVWDVVADGTCLDTPILFLSGASFNIITNFSLLVLPLHSIFTLNLAQSKKVILLGLFCILGGLIMVISIFRLCSLLRVNLTSPDMTWNMVPYTIWLCVEMEVGLFCTCILFLRPLFTICWPERRHEYSTRSRKDAKDGENFEQLGSERQPVVYEEERRSQVIDEEKWPLGIMVKKEFKLSEEKSLPLD